MASRLNGAMRESKGWGKEAREEEKESGKQTKREAMDQAPKN